MLFDKWFLLPIELIDLTILDKAWGLEGALCLEHLDGSTQTWILFKYNETESLDPGDKDFTPLFHVLKNTTKSINKMNQKLLKFFTFSSTQLANLDLTSSNCTLFKFDNWPMIVTGNSKGSCKILVCPCPFKYSSLTFAEAAILEITVELQNEITFLLYLYLHTIVFWPDLFSFVFLKGGRYFVWLLLLGHWQTKLINVCFWNICGCRSYWLKKDTNQNF